MELCVLQNLKKVRFKLNDYGPEVISFEVQGPCELKASEINKHITQFEVLKQDLVIANVTDEVNLKFNSYILL